MENPQQQDTEPTYQKIIKQKLKFQNINEIFFTGDEDLSTLENLTKLDRLGIEQAIYDINQDFTGGFKNAYDLVDSQNQTLHSTGIKDQTGKLFVDEMLKGGIGQNDLLEVTGPEHSGKTLFIYKLIDSFIQRTKNNTEIIYLLDSGASFSFDILEKKFGYTYTPQKTKLHEKVKKMDTQDPEDLMVALCYIQSQIKQQNLDVKCIFIDSLTQIFGQDLDFEDYKKYISEFQKKILEISQQQNIAIVVSTNMSDFNAQYQVKQGEYQKQPRQKSLMKAPWNFIPTKTLMLQRTVYESDMIKKKCLQTYSVLENQTLLHDNQNELNNNDYRQQHEEY